MNEQSAEVLAKALDELHAQVGPFGMEWSALKRRLAEALRGFDLVETEHCTVIDRRLLERMPERECDAYAAVCNDGSGGIYNGYETFSGNEVCEFGPGYHASTKAMQAWLDANEKPAWNWPVPDATTPVDAPVYVRDRENQEWKLRNWAGKVSRLLCCWSGTGVTEATASGVTNWKYVVLVDPDNPAAPPPANLVPGKEGE